MPLNKKLIGGAFIIVALVAAAYFGGLFSITAGTPPTCTFTETNKTCTVEYTLPAERALSTLTYDFDYAAVPDTMLLGQQTVSALNSYNFREPDDGEYTDNTYYLYKLPNWGDDPYDLVVEATGTHSVSCSAFSKTARTYIGINSVTRPWSGDTVVVSRREDEINNPALTNTSLLMTDNRYQYLNVYERNQYALGGIQTARCYRSSSEPAESFTNPYTLQVVVPNTYVYGQTDTRFMVRAYKNIEGSTSGTLDVPRVTVAYHKALYPTNVAYKVGSFPVETFTGPQKNTTSSLDIADQVNLECNRGISIAECKLNITITSTQPGLLWLTKTGEVMKVASENAVISELQGTLSEKVEYINQLNASIQQKADLIAQLTNKSEELGLIINQLNVTIQEKAQLVEELGATVDQQIIMIQQFNATVNDQAAIINQLTANLAEKAMYVSQLQAENEQQAALIKAMNESFQNEGSILAHLNATVSEDAYFISQFSNDTAQQAQIIAGMQNTIDRDKAIIAELIEKEAAEKQQLKDAQALLAEQEALLAQVQQEKKGATSLLFVVIGVAAVAILGGYVWLRRKK